MNLIIKRRRRNTKVILKTAFLAKIISNKQIYFKIVLEILSNLNEYFKVNVCTFNNFERNVSVAENYYKNFYRGQNKYQKVRNEGILTS